MKYLDTNWQDILAVLPFWEELPSSARKDFLDNAKLSNLLNPPDFGESYTSIEQAGFLEPSANGRHVKVKRNFNTFVSLMKVLYQYPYPPDKKNAKYFEIHLNQDEYFALNKYKGRRSDAYHLVIKKVTSVQWLQEFLQLQRTNEWERAQLRSEEEPYFVSMQVMKTVKSILRLLMEVQSPIPLQDLAPLLGTKNLELLGTSIRAGLRYLLFYVWVTKTEHELILGIWPEIAYRLHRPKAAPPKAVLPSETYHNAFQLEDMMTILVICSTNSLRVRGNDLILFANARKMIVENMIRIPSWLEEALEFWPDERIGHALHNLKKMDFLQLVGKAGKDLRLEITPKGLKWLEISYKERLKTVFDFFTKKIMKPYRDKYDQDHTEFIPLRPWVYIKNSNLSLDRSARKAFSDIQEDTFVEMDEFLKYHKEKHNPLLQERENGKDVAFFIDWGWYKPKDSDLEDEWERMLRNLLIWRLIAFGGCTAGQSNKDTICFSLTDPGRYLLGLQKNFEYSRIEEKQVIVQPNFEIVFLAPSPAAEASIGRFAERTGKQMGVLFKITKKSIFAAASTGMTLSNVLDILEENSTKEIPHNVEHEIRNWFSHCRQVRFQPAILIHCPDKETAMRILSAGGKKVIPVTDTIVELTDPKQKKPLIRKLKDIGVFLEL